MEIKTFAQLDKIVKDYKYICLCNSDGAQLVNYNNGKAPKAQKIAQIKKRLESEALPDGIYKIMARDALKGETADEIIFIKGKGAPADQPEKKTTLKECSEAPAVLTYAEAVRLNTEVARLNFEVQSLTEQNSRLIKDIEELEQELEQLSTAAAEKLSEPAPSTLSTLGTQIKDILPSITALFDTHFQLKDRQLKIQEAQNKPPQERVIYQPATDHAAESPEMPENTFILDQEELKILNYFEALKNGNSAEYQKITEAMGSELNAANNGGAEHD